MFWHRPGRDQGGAKISFGGEDSTHQCQSKKVSTSILRWFWSTLLTFWHFRPYLGMFGPYPGRSQGVSKTFFWKSFINTNLKRYQPTSKDPFCVRYKFYWLCWPYLGMFRISPGKGRGSFKKYFAGKGSTHWYQFTKVSTYLVRWFFSGLLTFLKILTIFGHVLARPKYVLVENIVFINTKPWLVKLSRHVFPRLFQFRCA